MGREFSKIQMGKKVGRRDCWRNCDVIRKCGGDSLREKKMKAFERKMVIKEGACN